MIYLKSTMIRFDEICHASFQSPEKLQEHLDGMSQGINEITHRDWNYSG